MSQTLFVRSEANEKYISLLVELFEACPIGGIVSYADMARALGFDPRDYVGGRGFIREAQKRVNETHGKIFKAAYNDGYTVPETPIKVVDAKIKGISRMAARTQKQLGNHISHTNMTKEDHLQFASRYTQLGLVRLAASKPPTPDTSPLVDAPSGTPLNMLSGLRKRHK